MLDEETESEDGVAIFSTKIGIGRLIGIERSLKEVSASVIGELLKFKMSVPRILPSASTVGDLPWEEIAPTIAPTVPSSSSLTSLVLLLDLVTSPKRILHAKQPSAVTVVGSGSTPSSSSET